MRRTRLFLAAPVAGLALGLLLPVALAAQGQKPDFSGSYAFVQKRSDDLKEAVARSVGPQFTRAARSPSRSASGSGAGWRDCATTPTGAS